MLRWDDELLAREDPARIFPDQVNIDLVKAGPEPGDPSQIAGVENALGDRPQTLLIVLMTSALVVAIWGVAKGRLVQLVESALDSVCGGIGC